MIEEQIVYKVIIIGDCRVGKTSYLHSIIGRNPYLKANLPPTIGVEYAPTKVNLKRFHKVVNVNIWDTCNYLLSEAGAEKYKSITSSYYRKCQGVIMMFDVTEPTTFSHLKDWLQEVKKRTKGPLEILVVGNKMDLVESGEKERKVSEKELTDFCVQNSLIYRLSSAISNFNVIESFSQLVEKIFEQNLQIMQNDKHPVQQSISESYIKNLSLLSDKNKHQPRKEEESSQCAKCC